MNEHPRQYYNAKIFQLVKSRSTNQDITEQNIRLRNSLPEADKRQ